MRRGHSMDKSSPISLINLAFRICPPVLWDMAKSLKKILFRLRLRITELLWEKSSPESQDLELYWDARMANILESWGEGNVWTEIQFLMANLKGKVLDIACGTGKCIEILSQLPSIELYGCDISDFLVKKAIDRGIPENHLVVCDATKTDYADGTFEYAYSIGSLEHFTEQGIIDFLVECRRIVKGTSFHMVPVSDKEINEGWLKTRQSFHNNSTEWWMSKFASVYTTVISLNSTWADDISTGKWFICFKN
jgi:ubiquinone/menaquinone biosynthesis C-methylase UbiE